MNLSTKLFVQCSSPLIKHSKNRFEKKCLQILQFSQVLLGIFNFFCCVVVTTIMSNITDDKRKIAHRHFSIRWIWETKIYEFYHHFCQTSVSSNKKSWKQQHSIPQTDSTFKRVVWLGELTMLTPHFSLRGWKCSSRPKSSSMEMQMQFSTLLPCYESSPASWR